MHLFAAALLGGVEQRPAGAVELASARLIISGTRLSVSPESQTVPFETPTIVETRLEGFDPELGTLPASLRVLADFTGPEISGMCISRVTSAGTAVSRRPRASLPFGIVSTSKPALRSA